VAVGEVDGVDEAVDAEWGVGLGEGDGVLVIFGVEVVVEIGAVEVGVAVGLGEGDGEGEGLGEGEGEGLGEGVGLIIGAYCAVCVPSEVTISVVLVSPVSQLLNGFPSMSVFGTVKVWVPVKPVNV
jgi:hypothetical protein